MAAAGDSVQMRSTRWLEGFQRRLLESCAGIRNCKVRFWSWFLLWVRLGFSLNCHTIVTTWSQASKKNPGEWQDFFCFSEIFFKSPPTMRRLHFKTTPTEIKTISRIPRHRPQATEFQKSCQSTGANKGDIMATNSRKAACLEGFEPPTF